MDEESSLTPKNNKNENIIVLDDSEDELAFEPITPTQNDQGNFNSDLPRILASTAEISIIRVQRDLVQHADGSYESITNESSNSTHSTKIYPNN